MLLELVKLIKKYNSSNNGYYIISKISWLNKIGFQILSIIRFHINRIIFVNNESKDLSNLNDLTDIVDT
jgi:hypothetical protein